MRKAPTKAQNVEAGPVTTKRKSPMPLKELDVNIIELRSRKMWEQSYKVQKCESESDGGVVASAGQYRRA